MPNTVDEWDLVPFELNEYFEALSTVVTGIAPTLMVAKISLSSSPNAHASTTHQISGLQFQSNLYPAENESEKDDV
ncbi:hypothetical protein JR316_0004349 [Psilocybe cubensis]|nr:hypothetical protein JR316_0004349 [Psilocybe cubensis]KAH9482251.1 hypothetical protein JR316_0004349 [Psilocybe cubensis]